MAELFAPGGGLSVGGFEPFLEGSEVALELPGDVTGCDGRVVHVTQCELAIS